MRVLVAGHFSANRRFFYGRADAIGAMENLNVSLLLFNRKMDGLVENILAKNLGTPEFRAQHVRAVNLCRRVAEHDVDLASELFFTFIMLGIHFGLAALHPERS